MPVPQPAIVVPGATSATPSPAPEAVVDKPRHSVMAGIERFAGVSWTSVSGSEAKTSYSSVALNAGGGQFWFPAAISRLAVDYRLKSSVYIGVAAGFARETLTIKEDRSGSTTSTDLTNSMWIVSPRVGFGIAASDILELVPRVGVTFGGSSQSQERSSSQSMGVSGIAITGELIAMFHVAEFIHPLLGLSLDRSISGKATSDSTRQGVTSSTSVNGALTNLQGWIGIAASF